MSGSVTVTLNAVPPSLNTVGSRGAQLAFHRHKKRWQNDIEKELMFVRLPRGLARVRVDAVLRFPVRRRRDRGNFQALLDKAIGDALVNGRWLADDTPDLYRFDSLEFELGGPQTVLTLAYTTPTHVA